MATISACAVGSLLEVTRLVPSAITLPSFTTIAANGPPRPECTFSMASSMAFCMNGFAMASILVRTAKHGAPRAPAETSYVTTASLKIPALGPERAGVAQRAGPAAASGLASQRAQSGIPQDDHGNAERHPEHKRVLLGPRPGVHVGGVDLFGGERARRGGLQGARVSQARHLILRGFGLALAVEQPVAPPGLLPEDHVSRCGVKRRASAGERRVVSVHHFNAPVAQPRGLGEVHVQSFEQRLALTEAVNLSRAASLPDFAVLARTDTHPAAELGLLRLETHLCNR